MQQTEPVPLDHGEVPDDIYEMIAPTKRKPLFYEYKHFTPGYMRPNRILRPLQYPVLGGKPRLLPIIEKRMNYLYICSEKEDIFKFEMAGLKKSNTLVKLDGKTLNVKGKYTILASTKMEDQQHQQRGGGSSSGTKLEVLYRATVDFRVEPDPGTITVKLEAGVLTIEIPTQYTSRDGVTPRTGTMEGRLRQIYSHY